MSSGLYQIRDKDLDTTLDLTRLKPYGDTMNDGKVQLSFTLPVKDDDKGAAAAVPILPETIRFIQSEDLLKMYPSLSPRERETEAARKYGAIFVIGIGGKLSDGKKHDGRAPDYDDWTTPSDGGYKGLNGDIILWNPVLESAFEVSSMGIRVDKTALLRQLELDGCPERADLEFHKALLEDRIPLSIGGGIGQSRLCMFLLRCAHIGEVQASIWPEEMVETCRKHNIYLK